MPRTKLFIKVMEIKGISCREISSKRVYLTFKIGQEEKKTDYHSARLFDFIFDIVCFELENVDKIVKIKLMAAHHKKDEEVCRLELPVDMLPKNKVVNGLFGLNHDKNHVFMSIPQIAISFHLSTEKELAFSAERGNLNIDRLLQFLSEVQPNSSQSSTQNSALHSRHPSEIGLSPEESASQLNTIANPLFKFSKFHPNIQISATNCLKNIPPKFHYVLTDQNFIRACIEKYVSDHGGYEAQSQAVMEYLSLIPVGYVSPAMGDMNIEDEVEWIGEPEDVYNPPPYFEKSSILPIAPPPFALTDSDDEEDHKEKE